MATHSRVLAWKISGTGEPGGLPSMGSHRVGHDGATSLPVFPFTPWRRTRQPTAVFLPGEPRDGGARRATVYGVAQIRTRRNRLSSSSNSSSSIIIFESCHDRGHDSFTSHTMEEGHGNPPQCSCLENPRDGGARRATVYGVAQIRTRRKRRSSSSSSSIILFESRHDRGHDAFTSHTMEEGHGNPLQ